MTYYRPQRSWGKVMFLHVSVILFTRGGGVCPIACWDTPPEPEAGTPPQTRGRHPPRPGTPPGTRDRHPLPGSRHPSGIISSQRSAFWEIRATSGRYASYWNAILLKYSCHCSKKHNFTHELSLCCWRKLCIFEFAK